jgi:DNA-directed RNA polymerase specialized sigma24 family protein
LPATQIGLRLNIPAATVRVRLHRARKAAERALAQLRGEGKS